MPFAGAQAEGRVLKVLRAIRGNRIRAYGAALAVIALAIVARLAIDERMTAGVPFITFYPAIIFATFVGGLGPGIMATVLASLTAWYFFLPPAQSWALGEKEVVSLIVFVVVDVINITLIVYLNRALETILSREREVRTLIEAAPSGIVVVDDQGKITLLNATAEKLFGYTRLELLGQGVEVLVPDRLVNAHEALRQKYMAAPDTRAMGVGRDLHARRKDGSEFPVEIGLNALSQDGKRVVLATVVDISERRKAVETQRLIVNEMRHRMQNLFAIVHALATRSLDEKQSIREARPMLLSRIQALAHAHAMLADAAWQGAPLNHVTRATLDAFTDRATISGCDITVTPSAAQHFALILHELATNAAKYGALSVPTGRITIEGEVNGKGAENAFSFRWLESGGPPTKAPIRKGFGSSILVDAAKGFGTHAALDYKPEGISYELIVPLKSIQPTTDAPSLQPRAGAG
jgi:PAS domain S-box-containing protein